MGEILDAIEDGDEVRWNDRANTATVDGDHYGHPRVFSNSRKD